jgi:lysozyme
MKISDNCKKLIIHHEGVRYKPYRCPAALWTCGIGSVLYPDQAKLPMAERLTYELKKPDNRVWSKDEVNALLEFDLKRFVRGVARYCPAPLTQGQLDALVSFSFNVGLGTLQRSTLRQKHNRGDFAGAADEFLKFTKGGGRVLKGLVNRRNDERAMYLG